jgi:Matrixin
MTQTRPSRPSLLSRNARSSLDSLENRVLFASDCGCEATKAVSHGGACGCSGCAALQKIVGDTAEINCGYDILMRQIQSEAEGSSGGSGAYNGSDRWGDTATNGPTGRRGTGLTLTYSFVPDGTSLPSGNGEPATPSDLFARFNAVYGSPSVWQPIIRNAVELWGANSGITFVYEPGANGTSDDGAAHPSSPGLTNVRGDIRIGGHRINGNGGVLAYNYFPDTGDMVIDTDDNVVTNSSDNNIRLRNIISHEIGHGLGFAHSCPQDNTKLMEPFLNTGFSGLGLDELIGVNYLYGDRLEKNNGNNNAANATSLGTLAGTSSSSINTLSVVNSDPNRPETGFTDNDYFGFTLTSRTQLTFTVSPQGTTYLAGTQNFDGSCSGGTNFDALTQLNLRLEVRGSNGTTVLQSANSNPAGQTETLTITLDPGNYFVRVHGDSLAGSKNTQMYNLTYAWQPVASLPLAGGFDAISPSPRDASLGSAVVRFNQAVNPATFTVADLTLSRDGQSQSLTGATLATTNNIDFTISNLSSLTTRLGTFTLSVIAGSVSNAAGDNNASAIPVSWTMTGLPGTSGNDTFTLRRVNGTQFDVSVNGSTPYVVNSSLPAVNVQASAGNDTLRIEGNLNLGSNALNYTGTAGQTDIIQFVGATTGSSWELFTGRVVGPTNANYANVARLEFTGSTAFDSVSFFSATLPALVFNLSTGNDQFSFTGQSTFALNQTILGNTISPRLLVQSFATLNVSSRLTLDQLTVGEGSTVNLQGSANRLITKSLTVAGRLDVGQNEVIVDYPTLGPSTAASIRDALFAGYNGGAWNGTQVGSSSFRRGIVSSGLNLANGQTLAWADTAELYPSAGGVFNGQPVDNSAVVFGPRLAGDSDLNGTVDFADLVRLARSFNQNNKSFFSGDFNYSVDGLVDFSDLVLLARNFNRSFLPPAPPAPLTGGGENFRRSVLV